jgi:hypothetical protein
MQAHLEEIVFIVNNSDPSLVEAYTNSADLARQLAAHGGKPYSIPQCDMNTLRGQIAQRLPVAFVLFSRQVQFLSLDEMAQVLEQRRRDRQRKQAALSEQERERRAKRAKLARQWRARQSPEKRAELRRRNNEAKRKTMTGKSEYERELRRYQERQRYAQQANHTTP